MHINKNEEPQPAEQRYIDEITLINNVGLDFYGIGEHQQPDFDI